MKRSIIAIAAVISLSGLALAEAPKKAESQTELRPSQKIMRARDAWMKSMNDNFNSGNLAAVAKDAKSLGDQTKTVGEKQTDPRAKEHTLAISKLTKDVIASSGKGDAAATLVSLREIKNHCGTCHILFRDKDKK